MHLYMCLFFGVPLFFKQSTRLLVFEYIDIFTVFLRQQLISIFRFFGKMSRTTKNLIFFLGYYI